MTEEKAEQLVDAFSKLIEAQVEYHAHCSTHTMTGVDEARRKLVEALMASGGNEHPGSEFVGPK